jgi:cardiolipin synthase A/B
MRIPKPRNVLLAVLIVAVVIAAGLLIAQDQESLHVRSPLGAEERLFPDYLARLLGRPLTSGDAYTVLRNGEEAFPAMLGAIERAKTRISFETYIYSPGEVADRFTAALAGACRRGVLVQIVLDAVGSSDGRRSASDTLRDAGCQVATFNPVRHSGLEEVNYRTHRKILVVDGTVGFVGGIGVADHWQGDAESEDRWRDTQFEIRGPAVDYVEAGFHENWIETGGIVEPTVSPR